MISCRNLLLSGQKGPQLDTIATSVFHTPEIRAGAAVEVVYKFVVESIVGAPTAASLRVATQVAQRSTGGHESVIVKVTDAAPIWQTLNNESDGEMLPDGDWPTFIADQTLVSPLVIVRRVRGGCSTRLAITPSYTGGTSPAFIMSAECEVRY